MVTKVRSDLQSSSSLRLLTFLWKCSAWGRTGGNDLYSGAG